MSPKVYSHSRIKALIKNTPIAIEDMDLLRAALIDQFPNLPQRVEILYLVARFQTPSRIQADPGNPQLLNREIHRLTHETGLSKEFLASAVYSWAKGMGGEHRNPTHRQKKESPTSLTGAISPDSLTEWNELNIPESVLEPRHEKLESILHDTFPNNQGIKERMLFLHRAGSLHRLRKNRQSIQRFHQSETERLHQVYEFPKPWLRAGLNDALQWFGLPRIGESNPVPTDSPSEKEQESISEVTPHVEVAEGVAGNLETNTSINSEEPQRISSNSLGNENKFLTSAKTFECMGAITVLLINPSIVSMKLLDLAFYPCLLLFGLLVLYQTYRIHSILESKSVVSITSNLMGGFAAVVALLIPIANIPMSLAMMSFWADEFNELNRVKSWGLSKMEVWPFYLVGCISLVTFLYFYDGRYGEYYAFNPFLSSLIIAQTVFGNMAISRANAIKDL